MSKLIVGFVIWMLKRATGSGGESTSISDGKRSKRSSRDKEAQKDWAIISVDSPDPAFNDQPVLEGAPNEAGAPLKEGIPSRGPSNVDKIGDGHQGSCCSNTLAQACRYRV